MLDFLFGGLKASSVSWQSIDHQNPTFVSGIRMHKKPGIRSGFNVNMDPQHLHKAVLRIRIQIRIRRIHMFSGLPDPHPDPLDIDVSKVTDEIAGSGSASGSINQRYGSADPDQNQNFMDPLKRKGKKHDILTVG